MLVFYNNSYGHSGRTDSNGGHKDNKNVSGLGSYHYHCGGNPPHLHENGVCPYDSNQNSNDLETTSNTSEKSLSNNLPTIIEVKSVNLLPLDRELKVGESIKLNAEILPENATDKTISWTSSDQNILKVDNNGNIVALNKGNAKVTVTSKNGINDSIDVTVISVPEKINLINESVNLEVGEELMLTTFVEPVNSTYKLLWNSTFSDIVAVDNNGKIKALKEGQSTISIKTDNNKTDSVIVNVKNKEIKSLTNDNEEENLIENVNVISVSVVLLGIYLKYKK